MERLYRGFDIITNRVHTSNQQRRIFDTLRPAALICKGCGIAMLLL